MGAWGVKSFDNDDALDWIGKIETLGDASLLQSTLETIANCAFSDDLAFQDAALPIAAAEVVSALKGSPAEDLPEEITDWVKKHDIPKSIQTELVQLALKALGRIRIDSELKELWEETQYAEAWHSEIMALEARLAL
ncbi:MAG: DUF4259 domain-containing protein [Anaerolineae bacterium]|nr:DUF4259 domain-containing protein [Gloeobacterales cyanobacterium ES-bin-313]